jgi:peptidoglycan hydrolase CwlO-like protein
MNPHRKIREASLGITRWVGSIPSIILHTVFFAGCFIAVYIGAVSLDRMLLVLTTIVSLEAIYLAIFIQMSLNLTRESLAEVEEDIDEIQEDVDEIQHDVDEIQHDVDEIQEDIEEIEEDKGVKKQPSS